MCVSKKSILETAPLNSRPGGTACDVFPVLFITKLFSFPEGYRKHNQLKVQRQSRNGSEKGSIQGNQIHKSRKVQVESSGASSNQEVKSTGCMVLCAVPAK